MRIEGWRLRVEENLHAEHVYHFIFCAKKYWLLKALLTCTYIPRLLDSFDLPNCSLESRKRYILRFLLLMCVNGRGRVLELILPSGRAPEGRVCNSRD